MLRRVLVLMFAFSALLAADAGSAVSADLTEREARKLVGEYLQPDSTDERRSEILAELKSNPLLCQKALKSSLDKNEERARALQLATLLRVPGLYDSAKKYIDDDEHEVTRYAFVSGDKGATVDMVKRWLAAQPQEARYTWILKELLRAPVELDAIEKLKEALKDGERQRDAGAALAFQFGADEADPQSLLSQWDKLLTTYKIDSKAFRITGESLLETPRLSGKVKAIGHNLRLSPESQIVCKDFAEKWNKGDFTVSLRARVADGEGCRIIFYVTAGTNGWVLTYKGGEWIVPTTAGDRVVKAAEGEWAELRFTVTDKSTEELRLHRYCKIEVDGKTLLESGNLHGTLKYLWAESKGATLTIGALQIQR